MIMNTQRLNSIYQKHNIPYPEFQFTKTNCGFVCHFRLPNGAILSSEPKRDKRTAKECVAEIAVADIDRHLSSLINRRNIFPQYSGFIIVDGDNITKPDQLELLYKFECAGTPILFVVASTYDTTKIKRMFKKIMIIPNEGKQSVDIWIIGYVSKYDFGYGSDISIISGDNFIKVLSKIAPMFHDRHIAIKTYNSVSNFIDSLH